MRTNIFQLIFVLGSLVSVKSVEWRNAVRQVKNKVVHVKTGIIEEVRTADIRLMVKDKNKAANDHPVLPSAQIDVSHASSIFDSGWIDYYTWVSDLDTEYRSVDRADELFLSNHYNSSQDTLLILHDRCGNAKDQSMMKVVEALKLRNFDVNYNIMLMDFKKFMCNQVSPTTGLSKMGYNPQMKLLAVEIGSFIFKGIEKGQISAQQVNLVSFGVSTKLAALVATHTKTLSGSKINSMFGLDPPVHLWNSLLNKDSVNYIHIYHTFKLVPGTEPSTGHATADFVLGGAKRGPQCKTSLKTSCFKEFGVQLFVASLLYPKLFAARWCPNYRKFSDHFCDSNEYGYVTFPPDNSVNGTYQLEIDYQFPFGKGLDGIYEEKKEDEADSEDKLEDLSNLSPQEYDHRMEMEVKRIRDDMMACIGKKVTPAAVIKCVMGLQPTVRRLVKQRLIRKISCVALEKSPTGKKCEYETQTQNTFFLPF